MKAMLKAIWLDSSEISLDAYAPDNAHEFSLWLQLGIGPDSTDEADYFQLHVCTPDWLKYNGNPSKWGRHMLIVQKYDLAAIKKEIQQCVNHFDGTSWDEIAKKLSRFFDWEYEDYHA